MYCANEACLMLTLGLGYIVLLMAKKEGGVPRKIGLIIGIFLVFFSASMLAANLLLKLRFLSKGCPLSQPRTASFIKEQDSAELDFPIKK